MKPKDLVLGLCIAALLVSELFLFSANQQKHDAQSKMDAAQHDAAATQAKLQQVQSASDSQAMENMRLNAENKSLTRKLSDLQRQNTTLNDASQQLSQQLTSVQQAAVQQQQQIQQMQYDTQQTQVTNEQTSCMNNLRQIEAAKNEWALETGKAAGAVPTENDLLPYLTGGIFPVCPSGGVYTIGAIGSSASCSIHGSLPAQ
ncbi:MAG TPA: hypothetical protein VGN23_06015 [Verrucomicrobiae bacterium]|jgi:hypothetical protein